MFSGKIPFLQYIQQYRSRFHGKQFSKHSMTLKTDLKTRVNIANPKHVYVTERFTDLDILKLIIVVWY